MKEENSEAIQIWDEAIKELKKGDHYILVMRAERRIAVQPWGFWKGIGASFLLVIAMFLVVALIDFLKSR